MDVNTEQDYSESAQPFHKEITGAPKSDDADGLVIECLVHFGLLPSIRDRVARTLIPRSGGEMPTA
jgi:hypothetical protein